jgi:CHRD domain
VCLPRHDTAAKGGTMRKLFSVLALGLTMVALAAIPADAGDTNTGAHLRARDEVPANASLAQGQAIFHLSSDGTQLEYKLISANIDNVVMAHIHLAPVGVNGPIVAFLFGPVAPAGGRFSGVLAQGTITADDLIGPLAGQDLTALVDAIRAGNTYVNVHTDDGVAPPSTGPGDLPAGEIRGQIR